MTITPLAEINQRIPEAGRLRLGVKSGRAMKSIDTFRMTSPHRDLIEEAARQFGAKQGPRLWDEPKAAIKGQWEVITETSELKVLLPPGALSCWYELWGGGGCLRRCDGETCQAVVGRGDAASLTEVPCLCAQNQNLECKPTSRLSVILPDLPLRGVWRMDTHGWYAMHELSGMESLIANLQHRMGVIEANLTIQSRTEMRAGQRKNFVVPVLTLSATAMELVAGQADVRALGRAEAVAELEAAPTDEPVPTAGAMAPAWDEDPDDDIVDAEIVEIEPEPTSELHAEALMLAASLGDESHATEILRVFVMASNRGGKVRFDDLTDRQRGWCLSVMRDVAQGKLIWENPDQYREPAKLARKES